jgi:hypothetical protein
VSPLKQKSYVVQGVQVNLSVEDRLSFLVSNYFRPLHRGEQVRGLNPINFEICLVKDLPLIPPDSVRVISSPLVTIYRNGGKIYFSSKSGATICMDPIIRKAKGFFKKEIIRNPGDFSSLLGSSLVEVLKYYGLYFLHAAALYVNKMACLFSGDGGCGKTTIALSLVREGFRYVSDDSLFLKNSNGEIIVSPMYKHFHIDQELANRFPEISQGKTLTIPEGTKVPLDVSSFFPDSFIPSLRPDAIIFPRMTSNGTSMLNQLPQTESYRRLLKQTVLAVDNNVSRDQLRNLENLVKQTRGFELLSGRDIYEDPKILISLMNGVNHQNENNKEI